MENIITIEMDETLDHSELFGSMDRNLSVIRESLDAELVQRDNRILITGPDAAKAEMILRDMIGVLKSGEKLDPQKVSYIAALVDKKLVYRETRLDDGRRMAIKLVVEGMNDVRHPPRTN